MKIYIVINGSGSMKVFTNKSRALQFAISCSSKEVFVFRRSKVDFELEEVVVLRRGDKLSTDTFFTSGGEKINN